jgi:ATP-dependent RNA helicase MRH4
MLRPKTSACLLCSFRAARQVQQASIRQWQPAAPLSIKRQSGRSSSRPSRMSLAGAQDVASSRPKNTDTLSPRRRRQDGPFGGMNLKEAKIRGVPERRPGQTEKGRGRDDTKKSPKGFKALKMQRALAPISYLQRSQIRERISAIESFKQFDLLPSVQSSIATQALED